MPKAKGSSEGTGKGSKSNGSSEASEKGSGRGSGLAKTMKLSDELADIVGVEQASRQELMKLLFAYLKDHDLKDPENKQFFFPDKKMAKVFGTERVRAYDMGELITEHLS